MKNLLILLSFIASIGVFAQEQRNSVSVTGEGKVYVVPDKVIIRARIEHSGESPSQVKQQNDEVVNRVFDYLDSEGIPSENIRSEYINLNKEYNYQTEEYSYSANQAISIRLEDMDQYEEIMSGLLKSGLNRIDGVQFQTSREEELRSKARKAAMLNAREKATELAEALEQHAGQAIRISEMENNGLQPVASRFMEMQSDKAGDAQTISPGEIEITVRVNVEFQLYFNRTGR